MVSCYYTSKVILRFSPHSKVKTFFYASGDYFISFDKIWQALLLPLYVISFNLCSRCGSSQECLSNSLISELSVATETMACRMKNEVVI
jgi:hypothetical protein